jgi:hypothetical protein
LGYLITLSHPSVTRAGRRWRGRRRRRRKKRRTRRRTRRICGA